MCVTRLFILSLFIASSSGVFAQYSYIQKLGNFGTVALPDTPKILEKEGEKVYAIKYRGVLYMANVGDVSEGLKGLLHKKNNQLLYNTYIVNAVNGINGELFYKNSIEISDHQGVEFGCKAKIKSQTMFMHSRVFAINDTLISCSILSSDSLSKNNKNITNFLDGLRIKNERELGIDNAAEMGKKTGDIIVALLKIALLILVIRGVLYVAKR